MRHFVGLLMKKTQSLRDLILLSGPLIFAQIAHISMQTVDTLMLGQLGTIALATGALGGAIVYNIAVFFVGILSSTGALLAQAKGSEDVAALKQLLSHCVMLSLLMSIPCVVLILYAPLLLGHLHLDVALIEPIHAYLKALVFGIPPWLVFFVLRDFVIVNGKTRIILVLSILSVPLNAFLNYLLMYGKLGLPALAITGIGIATSLVRWGMLLGLLAYVYFQSDLRKQLIFQWKIQWSLMAKMCKLGAPTGLMMALEIGMFSLSAALMGYFGVNALAAHTIALQCANAVFTIPLGISQAVSLQIGSALGSKQHSLINRLTYTALGLGTFIALILGLLFYEFRFSIITLFLSFNPGDEKAIISLAPSYLLMAGIFQLLDTLQIITIGSLRGMNDTFMPMVLGIVAYWLFGSLAVYAFGFALNWQGMGLWLGLCIGVGVSVILLGLRYSYLQKLFNLEVLPDMELKVAIRRLA